MNFLDLPNVLLFQILSELSNEEFSYLMATCFNHDLYQRSYLNEEYWMHRYLHEFGDILPQIFQYDPPETQTLSWKEKYYWNIYPILISCNIKKSVLIDQGLINDISGCSESCTYVIREGTAYLLKKNRLIRILSLSKYQIQQIVVGEFSPNIFALDRKQKLYGGRNNKFMRIFKGSRVRCICTFDNLNAVYTEMGHLYTWTDFLEPVQKKSVRIHFRKIYQTDIQQISMFGYRPEIIILDTQGHLYYQRKDQYVQLESDQTFIQLSGKNVLSNDGRVYDLNPVGPFQMSLRKYDTPNNIKITSIQGTDCIDEYGRIYVLGLGQIKTRRHVLYSGRPLKIISSSDSVFVLSQPAPRMSFDKYQHLVQTKQIFEETDIPKFGKKIRTLNRKSYLVPCRENISDNSFS